MSRNVKLRRLHNAVQNAVTLKSQQKYGAVRNAIDLLNYAESKMQSKILYKFQVTVEVLCIQELIHTKYLFI
jgi:hypothetical protein